MYYLYHFSVICDASRTGFMCIYSVQSHRALPSEGPRAWFNAAVVILKFLIFYEGTVECHFALGPANYVAGPHNSLSAAGESRQELVQQLNRDMTSPRCKSISQLLQICNSCDFSFSISTFILIIDFINGFLFLKEHPPQAKLLSFGPPRSLPWYVSFRL